MTANVGPGVEAVLNANGDHALTDERFHRNKDGSTWSETLAARGTVYASNVTGSWEIVYVPFVNGG